MRVGLPMYDPPELRREVDAWWNGLAAAFRREGVTDVPDRLDRESGAHALWSAPDLLFAQACGFPLIGEWADRLQYLATPRHAAPGCEGASYCSWIVVAADSTARSVDDLRGMRCSINGRVSHSGYNALRMLVAPLARNGRFFGAVSVSGSHSDSLTQIVRGEADVAAIDCVTYALLGRCRPDIIAATRVVGQTASAPGLPYVTRHDVGAEQVIRMRTGLDRAFADPGLASVRDDLLIAGLDTLPLESYRCMADMENEARYRGYVELG